MTPLRAVLEDAALEGAHALLCLGDLVGYGAEPAACVDAVAERAVAMVGGNHEHGAAGLLSLDWFNPAARAAALWTREQLPPDTLEWLGSRPLTATVDDVTLVHASPRRPEEWDYLVSAEDGFEVFAAFATRVCFVGHSHRPARVVAGIERPGPRGPLHGLAGGGAAGGWAALRDQRGQRGAAARPRPARGLRHLGPGGAAREHSPGRL